MAQVGVQQPTNLMDMFSSPSMMMGDIAGQQVNDQTLGNLINRQQAAQDMSIQQQKLPFELQQLGLQNQETQARIPGVQAQSGLTQNQLDVSNATKNQQVQAKISDLAKSVSDNDLTVAENGVKQLMVHPDPQVRAAGQSMFQNLYDIKKERDRLAIQGGNQIAAIKAQGQESRSLEQQQYEHGKYLKPFSAGIDLQIRAAKNPEEKMLKIQQAIQESQDDTAKQHYQDMYDAIKPFYDNYMQAKTVSAAGKVNASEVTGMPGITQPTAPAQQQVVPQQPEPAINVAPKAVSRLSPEQYNAWHMRAKQLNPNLSDLEIEQEAIKRGYR